MTTFRDAIGRDWTIEFDALTLGRLRDQYKIDLIDVGAGGYTLIERDEDKLRQALQVLCDEQIDKLKLTDKQFSRGLFGGESAVRAYQAVVAGAADFFPPKKWSAMLSSCKMQRQLDESWASLKPMLRLINDPDMPQAMTDSILMAVTEKFGEIGSTDLRSLAAAASAPGQAATPSSTATDSPDSAAPSPED